MNKKDKIKALLKIFLCHASEDKPAVRDLYYHLKKEGFDPWLDAENLLPGQEWQLEIRKAVRSSDIIIVCLSSRSITKSGFVQKELRYALDIADEQPEGAIFLIPLRFEECTVPDRLSKWQWVDFFEDKSYPKLVRALEIKAKELAIQIPKSQPSQVAETDMDLSKIIEDEVREARLMLEKALIRWQKTKTVPSLDTLKIVTAYAAELENSLDYTRSAFMLKAAIWYGQYILFWIDKNEGNEKLVPVLIEALQGSEVRPFYRVGFILENLDPSTQRKAVERIRKELPKNRKVEKVLQHAEVKTTLSFWQQELPTLIDPHKAKEILVQARKELKTRNTES